MLWTCISPESATERGLAGIDDIPLIAWPVLPVRQSPRSPDKTSPVHCHVAPGPAALTLRLRSYRRRRPELCRQPYTAATRRYVSLSQIRWPSLLTDWVTSTARSSGAPDGSLRGW